MELKPIPASDSCGNRLVTDSGTSYVDSSSSLVENEIPLGDESCVMAHRPSPSNLNDTFHQDCKVDRHLENNQSPVSEDNSCKGMEPDESVPIKKPLNYKPPRIYAVREDPIIPYKMNLSGHARLAGLVSKTLPTNTIIKKCSSKKPNESTFLKTNINSCAKASSMPVNAKPHQMQPQRPVNSDTDMKRLLRPSSNAPSTNELHSSCSSNVPVSSQSNGNAIVSKDNYRYHGQGNGGSGQELIRGPRLTSPNNSSTRTANFEKSNLSLKRDMYNLPDFQTEYTNARFYIIKSFGEADVHMSIKYKVWSSTQFGNNKLDTSFREVDENEDKCPVFLFFSVNSSGQFLGVAEMVGPVDYVKKMHFWMDDLWDGFFPVKWHIIKDVPFKLFRHIILKNNYNRCVTYTRDTQEVGLEQGLEMLKIFKNYSEQTSLLDDFYFYEEREASLKSKNSRKSSVIDRSGNDYHEFRTNRL